MWQNVTMKAGWRKCTNYTLGTTDTKYTVLEK